MDKENFCRIMNEYSKQSYEFDNFYNKINKFCREDIAAECKKSSFSDVAVEAIASSLKDSSGILKFFCKNCNCNFDLFNDSDIVVNEQVVNIHSYENLYDLICLSA
jgi:hypothetical protein